MFFFRSKRNQAFLRPETEGRFSSAEGFAMGHPMASFPTELNSIISWIKLNLVAKDFPFRVNIDVCKI